MARMLNEKRNACLEVSMEMGLVSPLIHVGQFKIDAAEVVTDYHLDVEQVMEDTPDAIAKDLNTDAETVRELIEVCSPDRLTCPREEEIVDQEDIRVAPPDTGLDTVSHWIKINKRRMSDRSSIKPTLLKSKYLEYDCCLEDAYIAMPATDENDIIEGPENVVTVAVNFPRSGRSFKHTSVNFRILGSQKLTDLRDAIPCALDEQPVGQFSDDPDNPKDIKCKDLFKSGYFFIENTFYNDYRVCKNDELSEVVYDWAKANDVIMPSEVKKVSMDDYTIDDLHLCLGSPYLYMHQGNCEHIIIFKDIRLLHPDDCMSRSQYPFCISRAKFKTPLCKVCNYFCGQWMTTNDEFSDEDPSFFCNSCFRMLHYNKDGSKAGEFLAYPCVNKGTLDY